MLEILKRSPEQLRSSPGLSTSREGSGERIPKIANSGSSSFLAMRNESRILRGAALGDSLRSAS